MGNRVYDQDWDEHRRECVRVRRVEAVMMSEDVTILTFYHGDWAVAERRIEGKSAIYAVNAAENWCCDTLKSEHFTMEERLRA